ncbi:Hypothetical predicted protein [Paramuricea clavata]|uniref:Uncharacterized protein n=1 Tax=Paramuricea clavata TaxID=317549 RepID=A0A6S7IC51_PARCT|nr:Hypothetical predicted protein [Paramuricea clavata]
MDAAARFINDSRGTSFQNNSKIKGRQMFRLKATKKIPANHEIFTSYGDSYWGKIFLTLAHATQHSNMARYQKGGNFRGKKYQRSKKRGGYIEKKIKNSKIGEQLKKIINVCNRLGNILIPKTKTKKTIQSGSSIGHSVRYVPPRRVRNTIPIAKQIMYQ